MDVFFPGNIFISRKSVASCDECDEDDGLTTSVVYKIGEVSGSSWVLIGLLQTIILIVD